MIASTNRKDRQYESPSQGASPYPSMQAAIYAALGCTKIDFRSPVRVDEAAAQIARFVRSSAEYANMLTALEVCVAALEAYCAGATPFERIAARNAIAKAKAEQDAKP